MTSATANIISGDALQEISAVFHQENIVQPGDENYQSAIIRFDTKSMYPSQLVLFPTSAQEVAAALKWVLKYKYQFAVAAGGHNSSGHSSSYGVVIDLRLMKSVSYDDKSSVVIAGPGNSWRELYEKLLPHEVIVVGGRISHVGMGFILGGGFSWISSRFGFGCDNLVAAEVVLASGEVVNASAKENEDLLWALKGGLGNFGIVTAFTLRAHPAARPPPLSPYPYPSGKVSSDWFHTVFTIPAVESPGLIAFLHKFSEENRDKRAAVYGYLTKVHHILVAAIHGTEDEFQQIFAPLLALTHIKKSEGYVNFMQLNCAVDEGLDKGSFRSHIGTISVPNLTPQILREGLNWLTDVCDAVPGSEGSLFIVNIVNRATFTNIKDEDSAWPHGRPFHYLGFVAIYGDSKNDEILEKFVIQAQVRFEEFSDDLPSYPNYALGKTTAEKLYKRNLDKLRLIKKKYDPNNVFNQGFPLG